MVSTLVPEDQDGSGVLSGRWKLLEWRFGATDTEVDIWLEKYRMPKSLLN